MRLRFPTQFALLVNPSTGTIDQKTLIESASNKEPAREVILEDTGIDVAQASFLK